ncbi:hypothetical protein BHE75_04084 [Sphingomonas haloaromaticamans]|uniref:PAS domain-containing protein n=1 Tax=Edaphosphingomonas haloaromaticamans TaxID=653954 RepID=A0A1S1HJQ3_9SPHN|nr:hypothetical protein BHE75_04084 [Sphingomonas haloaromaticamans]
MLVEKPPPTPLDLLPLTHSWPFFESGQRFDLGTLRDDAGPATNVVLDPDHFERRGIGVWQCDLADNGLRWSPTVYDLFGLPRGAGLLRPEIVALYCEPSRAAMERLRAHAIRHRRGFTIDVEILPARRRSRWMRLVAAPICEGGRTVRLHGLKRDVTHEYR